MTEHEIAFRLLRGALDGQAPYLGTKPIETSTWWSLFRLMQQNHVAAMVTDTVATLDVPREVKIPWIAEGNKCERWHRYQAEVQQDIIGLMERHGINTLVLKGTHTAQYYPYPERREFGDLDLYFYDRHGEADRIAQKELKVAIGNEAHHHSKYNYRGVTVESHYDFLNIHYPPSNRRYEAMLKELAPSPTFEVLFLLRHMAVHFAAARITLRDLVDWTLTCRALNDKVDWGKVQDMVTEYGMDGFTAAIDDIAERHFGYTPPMRFTHDPDTFAAVERNIVYGTTYASHTEENLGRLLWKLHRFRANRWQQRLVFNDSTFSLWLASLTSHAIKPQSILHKV